MSTLPDIYGDDSAQLHNYARFPVEFVRGEGMHLFDAEGNAYLDMLSGLGVNSLGHCHPAIVDAIAEQSAKLIHTSNLYWTQPAERLARELTQRSFADSVFFCNSGAEANEAAIKLARANAYGQGTRAREIVVLERAFHGRTMGALSATPQEDKQAPFAPLVHGFKTAPNNDAAALSELITGDTCAVMLEPVQGEGGVFAIPDDVLIAAREGCDAVGALLIFDEVQCGLGRTGTLFAYEQTPVVPDVVTLAKALGGGLPIGATLIAEHCAGALQPGFHGSTFGGNPVTTAAAIAALGELAKPETLAAARDVGDYLRGRLEVFGEPEGRGLMVGLQLDADKDAKAIVAALLHEHRILANATGPHTMRFLPPLTTTTDHVDELILALARELES